MNYDRPNILLIISDQLHADALGYAGNPNVHTPHHDRLAAEGCQLSRCYATNPVCAPSRSSLFFGRFPCETGVIKNELWPRDDLPTIGSQLGKVGYRCDYVGKWHLYPSMTFDIPGFDVPVSGINNNSYTHDSIVTRACESILASRSGEAEPFLLAACYQQPHDVCPWLKHHGERIEALSLRVPEDELPSLPENFDALPDEPGFVRRFRENRCAGVHHDWSERAWRYYLWCYDRQVECIDAHVGRVLDALDRSGQAENTLVICMSDHGEGLGHHRLQLKWTCYDEHMRIPVLVRWPGRIPAGSHNDMLASGLDLMTTCCELAGAPVPDRCRGESWVAPLCNGSQPPREAVFSECDASNARMVRTADWKYTSAADDGVEQLFDMRNDPGETESLVDQARYAAVRDHHRNLLAEWEAGHELAPGLSPFPYMRE